MGSPSGPIARLIQQLAKLPGRRARRPRRAWRSTSCAPPPEDAAALAAAIVERAGSSIRLCGLCWDLTEADPCALCADARRDAGLVCVVAQPQDVVAIERTAGYRGRYHVLHGVLSPLDGIGPDDLRVDRAGPALRRRGEVGQEVIVATSPSVEGEATAVYLAKLLRPLGVRTTRIATGVPIGGELEYADQLTLARAIDGRREI